ncbi:MAG: NUDIX domain-containing protein [Candidatus Cryptobacteroides sp.]
MTDDEGQEFFPVVEASGEVVGRATRAYCHSGSKLLHPVVHLHIIDRYSRIYLQKRSMKKDIAPGLWDTAVGGHVDYGESLMEALYREAHEELGLDEFNPVYLRTYVWETDRDREFVNVFAAVGAFELKPDHDEVDEGRWWSIEDIDAAAGKGVFTENFEEEFADIRHSLLALL